jgi:hypothetical protein
MAAVSPYPRFLFLALFAGDPAAAGRAWIATVFAPRVIALNDGKTEESPSGSAPWGPMATIAARTGPTWHVPQADQPTSPQ